MVKIGSEELSIHAQVSHICVSNWGNSPKLHHSAREARNKSNTHLTFSPILVQIFLCSVRCRPADNEVKVRHTLRRIYSCLGARAAGLESR